MRLTMSIRSWLMDPAYSMRRCPPPLPGACYGHTTSSSPRHGMRGMPFVWDAV
jgi:hypothetical protein